MTGDFDRVTEDLRKAFGASAQEVERFRDALQVTANALAGSVAEIAEVWPSNALRLAEAAAWPPGEPGQ